MILSKTSRNNIPIQNPTVAGTNDNFPILPDCSIAGISKLQTEAAVITPAANPVSALCSRELSAFLIKSTQAEPNVVPKNGIRTS